MADNTSTLAAFRVSAGTAVSFRNEGAYFHDVTPAGEGVFAKSELRPGDTVVITAPATAGTYRYYCSLHGTATGGQRGAMVVA